MSLTHKLSEIYKIFHEYLKSFPKQERFSLGQKIENTILEALEFILSAAYSPKYEKIQKIKLASDKTDLLKYLFRIAFETKSFNTKKYLVLEGKIIEIGKMIGGWLKSNSPKERPNRERSFE